MHVPSQPFDVIAAFAAPNSNVSLRSGRSLAARQVALPSESLSLLRIGKILIKPNLFGHRRCQAKQLLQNCQCPFSVQILKFLIASTRKCKTLNYWMPNERLIKSWPLFLRNIHRTVLWARPRNDLMWIGSGHCYRSHQLQSVDARAAICWQSDLAAQSVSLFCAGSALRTGWVRSLPSQRPGGFRFRLRQWGCSWGNA
jgi:hypothetical protein